MNPKTTAVKTARRSRTPMRIGAIGTAAALTLLWTALLLTGCGAFAPVGPRPEPPIPAAWTAAFDDRAPVPHADWWRAFDSPTLEALVIRSLEDSPDLAAAVERVIQAESQLRITGASLFPSLSLGGNTGWRRTMPSGGNAASSESTAINLNAGYEVDVWGRMAADVRASRATLAATTHDHDAVRLSLVAGVAAGYFQLLTLNARLDLARENLAIAERVMAIVAAKHRHGAASALDISRQESTVLGQQLTVLSLEEQQRQTLTALAILVGAPPQEFRTGDEPLAHLRVPAVGPGLPADLLLRRPDLARAEAQLAAAEANIVVARRALLPTVQLTGAAGTAGTALVSLADPTQSLSLTAAIAQTVFDGGRRRNQVTSSESRRRELLENYRKAILTALKEVEDALNQVDYSARQADLQAAIVDRAQTTLGLAEGRYRAGSDDLLTVLDAQRSLFQAQDQMVQSGLARLNGALSLYRVLGGGWRSGT